MITTLYAGILGVLYVVLTVFVVQGRFHYKVSIGDGSSEGLLKRIRLHGNFVEYVPVILILMILAEQEGTSEGLMHGMGGTLVLARVMHVIGFFRHDGVSIGRSGGTILTLLVLATAAIICIWSYFSF